MEEGTLSKAHSKQTLGKGQCSLVCGGDGCPLGLAAGAAVGGASGAAAGPDGAGLGVAEAGSGPAGPLGGPDGGVMGTSSGGGSLGGPGGVVGGVSQQSPATARACSQACMVQLLPHAFSRQVHAVSLPRRA